MKPRLVCSAALRTIPLWLILGTVASGAAPPAKLPNTVEFNRDIRPILSDRCYACHGPDKNKRKADLRLDTRDGLLGTTGKPGVVVARKPDESELWRRVTSTSGGERQVLRRWIAQGAKWEGHWAFLPIGRPQPPAGDLKLKLKNPIDQFILQALGEHHLTPSPQADPITLMRRLRFDLTGFPPPGAGGDAFAADPSHQADER